MSCGCVLILMQSSGSPGANQDARVPPSLGSSATASRKRGNMHQGAVEGASDSEVPVRMPEKVLRLSSP